MNEPFGLHHRQIHITAMRLIIFLNIYLLIVKIYINMYVKIRNILTYIFYC